MTETKLTGLEIAVIGMSGKFPGAHHLNQFWDNLKNGIETVSFFTTQELLASGVNQEELNNPNYVGAYGILPGKGDFDSSFFGYSPKEAESMEPMARILHEVAWEALEDAGYDPLEYSGAIGLYIGASACLDWQVLRILSRMGGQNGVPVTHMTENSLLVSTRISHKLNLMGPSVTLYTACSTSLVAIHTACRSLLTGECQMALAGAGNVSAAFKSGYIYQEGMIMSRDGHCRSFDALASGTLYGDGVGLVVLKRLKLALIEGDNILAVIKASAVNNDGSAKASYTAPGKKRITDVLRTTLKLSGLQPGELDFIEAHGTATPLGDTIEMEALKEAFPIPQKNRCGLGSVKSNFGHLDVAAGIAGFIKVVLALKHRLIPPSLHFQRPNPGIDFIDSPFYVNANATPLTGAGPFRAGLCSFGIGGTNGFIILESVAERELLTAALPDAPYLLLLSARTDSALTQMTQNLRCFLQENPHINLDDVVYTLQVGRHSFSHRRLIICSDRSDAIHALTTMAPTHLLTHVVTGKEQEVANDNSWLNLAYKWLYGFPVDWQSHYDSLHQLPIQQAPRRISLPLYPFERHYYWLETPSLLSARQTDAQPVVSHDWENADYPRPVLDTPLIAPHTEQEKALARVWQKFFRIREIGVQDDFFALGGDSLSAITLITDIHRQLKVQVPITQLFLTPTVAGLAQFIEHSQTTAENNETGTMFMPIPAVEEREYYPLSSAQKRLYVLHHMAAGGMSYNTPLVLELAGALDYARVVHAFNSLLARHESLRTSFVVLHGQPVQRVFPCLPFEVAYYDLETTAGQGTAQDRGEAEIISAFIRPFELTQPPLFRAALLRLAPEHFILLTDMHHIITDGSSINILVREFIQFYSGLSPAPLPLQYKDYAAWQNSSHHQTIMKKQEAFWLQVLADEIPSLHLPTDFVRPPVQSFTGSIELFTLSAQHTTALKELAKQENATLFMVLLAVYTVFLGKLTQQEDILVGSPIAGRNHVDLQQVIGMLVNTLVFRNYPKVNHSFREFLVTVKTNALAAFDNQDYLFEDLVARVSARIGRETSRNPIFDTVFNLLNFSNIEPPPANAAGIQYKTREYDRGVTIFDLAWQGSESPEGMTFKVEYGTLLFKATTIKRWIGYFKQLIEAVLVAPDQSLAHIEMISPEEKEEILHGFNKTNLDDITTKSISQLFSEQVARTPDGVALFGFTVGFGQAGTPCFLTYAALAASAQCVAYHLLHRGVRPEDFVAILCESSLNMIMGILGILQAGAAYLPIALNIPQERMDYILNDSQAHFLLRANDIATVVLAQPSLRTPLLPHVHGHQLAYVMYTSGSTGKPKGVMVEHGNVARLVYKTGLIDHHSGHRLLLTGALVFDISTWEIWAMLVNGFTVVIPETNAILIPEKLENLIKKEHITILHLIPQLFNQMAQQRPTLFAGLKWLLVGGDLVRPLYVNHIRNLYQNQGLMILHMYGPTENTTFSTYLPVTKDYETHIPIGKPIHFSTAYVLDKYDHLLPLGVTGELAVGGAGVARGYLNKPTLTAEKFRFCEPVGQRLYFTGDLCRWLPDGQLEFLGRSDFQVKIRGIRIELGEIEQVLLTFPQVQEAVVLALPEEAHEVVLCAYFVAAEVIDITLLREYLANHLPTYMIPAFFMSLEKMPLSANGKINRQALPQPQVEAPAAAPLNAVEKQLLFIWAEVLQRQPEEIGRQRSFFQLGGHSLKATFLMAQIQRVFEVPVPLLEIFKNPTISQLAQYIQTQQKETFLALNPVEEREYYPLSAAQKRLYFLQQLAPTSLSYHIPQLLPLANTVDLAKVKQVFTVLMARHESLRTSFFTLDETPVQRIHHHVPVWFESLTQDDESFTTFFRPFELSQAPLWRVGLLDFNHQQVLLIDMHHIISDGLSNQILQREFSALYQDQALPPVRLQYKDFALWQHHTLHSAAIQKQQQYWLKQFSQEIPLLFLPIDFPRPMKQSFAGNTIYFSITTQQAQNLLAMAHHYQATLFMVILTAFYILLSKLSGQEDIVVGVPVSGRPHADLESIMGMFVNTLALRHFPRGENTIETLLNQVKTHFLEALENQECQFEDLVELLAVQRDVSRNPLMDVMFSLQDFNSLTGTQPGNETAEYWSQKPLNGAAQFDLTLTAHETPDHLLFSFNYSTHLFKEETIGRYAVYLKLVIAAILLDPQAQLADIDYIPEVEKKTILETFNQTSRKYPGPCSVPQLVEEQVLRTPDALALVGPSYEAGGQLVLLTYSQLNEEAHRCALALQQRGIRPGNIVAINAFRFVETIAHILGILKAGCAYLPIDPDGPAQRRTFILNDSQTPYVLQQAHRFPVLPQQHAYGFAPVQINPQDLAYIIYTSGSTGKPKGVLIEHQQVVNLVCHQRQFYQLTAKSRVLQFSSLCFDVSVQQIFPTLVSGAGVVLVSKEVLLDPFLFQLYLNRHSITHLSCIPSFANTLEPHRFPSIKHVIVAGDVCSTALAQAWFPYCEFYNEYGPTETTVVVTQWRGRELAPSLTTVPIGKPLANTTIYLLDKSLKPVPYGVAGEVFIGGAGVGRGYLNAPAMTQQAFIYLPRVVPGSPRVYRTGDLARWLPDGHIQFLGRLDFQVKIRGYRIELGEIENKILEFPGIHEVVLLVYDEPTGEHLLCAYIVPDQGWQEVLLREFLSRELPEYMIPHYFVPLARIPLTSIGKIDRKALPAPDLETATATITPPGNAIEQQLATIWAQVLAVKPEQIGIHQHFFQLGGHSLKAMVLMALIHKQFQVKVELTQVFQTPTIAGMAKVIQGKQHEAFQAIEVAEEREYYPLAPAQKRLLVLQQLVVDNTSYNMPMTIPLAPTSTYQQISAVINTLMARHESLRTAFITVNEEAVQRIYPELSITIPRVTINQQELQEVWQHFVMPFDLSQAPLLRVQWVSFSEGGQVLLLDMHHIITDGTSQVLLAHEFNALLNGAELAPLKLQYKDYTWWYQQPAQRAALRQQQEFWCARFAGELPVLSLPYDFPRPVTQSTAGNSVAFLLETHTTAQLRTLAQKQETTLFMILGAVLTVMLAKLSGSEDIIIGTPIAARRHADLLPIIGMFVNTLALRYSPMGQKSFLDYLQEVKQNTLDAFENQEFPFEELVNHLAVPRDTSRNPIFDVMFNLLNQAEVQENPLPAPDVRQHLPGTAKFDLQVSVTERLETLLVHFEYATSLFKPASIKRFMDYFTNCIKAVCADPFLSLAAIPMIDRGELVRLLQLSRGPEMATPAYETVQRWFVEQAQRTPDAIAVTGPILFFNTAGQDPTHYAQLSYRALNTRADKLAVFLRSSGIGPDSIVALKVERSLEMIISLLAILKAGAAVLPLDPQSPPERMAYMLADSQAQLVLTGLEAYQPDNIKPIPTLENLSKKSDLLYLIYTSGSTGLPKGVLIAQSNLINLLHYQFSHTSILCARILQFATIGFDVAFQEIFSALLSGGQLFLIPREKRADIPQLFQWLNCHQVSTLFWPVSLLKAVFSEPLYSQHMPSCIRHIVCAGEQLVITQLCRSYVQQAGVFLHNHYGPSETHVVTTLTLEPHQDIPTLPAIGKPIANTGTYIVDHYGQLVPVGVAGELWLSGAAVGRGYWQKPQLTAEKFMNNPFQDGERLYRSGDLARWLSDGSIEFLGRIDQQVKIRGFRVELGEIERFITRYPGITECVVITSGEAHADQQLSAYVVAQQQWDSAALREFLVQFLPEFMIPAYFVPIAAIPLTPSKKVDRRALPVPQLKPTQEVVKPGNTLEAKLRTLWAEVLALDAGQISITSDFFQLGGHSLKATVLMAKIHKEWQVQVPLMELFKRPTIQALALYLQHLQGDTPALFVPLVAYEQKEYYPLSSAQKRLYFLQQLDPTSTGYNLPTFFPMAKTVDVARVAQVFALLMQRHEILRTSFIVVGEHVVQRIHDHVPFHIEPIQALKPDFVRAFELSHPPLFRAGWFVTPDYALLLIDIHHIITDGLSNQVLQQDFLALYQGETLSPLPIQYRDFVAWQQQAQESQQAQQAYWLSRLAGHIPVLHLPLDYPRPLMQSFAGQQVAFVLSPTTSQALKTLATNQGVTLFMSLLAIFTLLLAKLSGQEDILIGTPVAGRKHVDVERVIGLFVNTLVLRNTPTGNSSFIDFLKQVKTNALEAFENQDYPFEDVVETCMVQRDTSRNPLFDVLFSWQNFAAPSDRMPVEPGTDPNYPQTAKVDLELIANEYTDCIGFTLCYSVNLFKAETIQRWVSYFKQLTSHVLAYPEWALKAVEWLPQHEKETILYQFNQAPVAFPQEKTIIDLFAEQVQKTPDGIALSGSLLETIVYSGRSSFSFLSYRFLNHVVQCWAGLLQAHGVTPGDIVALKLERSLEMIIALLAIFKTGAAYLPIDPHYPQERVKFLLNDSMPRVLLAHAAHHATEQTDALITTDFPHLTLIDPAAVVLPTPPVVPIISQALSPAWPALPAYVIYTSGSTGHPKGVIIEQRALLNRLHWMQQAYPIGAGDTILQKTTVTFDVSVWELFWASITGARLCLLAPGGEKDPAIITATIQDQQVTVLHFVPSMLSVFLEYLQALAEPPVLSSLRQVFASGEVLTPLHLTTFNRFIRGSGSVALANLYGPTEAAIDVSAFDCATYTPGHEAAIPIGKPIYNISLYILDAYYRIVPVGVVGELYIAGAGLARGYLNQPQLTAERFITVSLDCLAAAKTRLYRTGDLACWLPDGNIHYVGRADFQVKVRGFRIELGEIEACLCQHEEVNEAVVLASEPHQPGLEKILSAFLVTRQERPERFWRDYLTQHLPPHMVPAVFKQVEQIPLTPSGKVDRVALSVLGERLSSGAHYVAPASALEQTIAHLWAAVLPPREVPFGVCDNFFDLGGTSMDVIRLSIQINQQLQREIPLVVFYKYTSIRALAEWLEQGENNTAPATQTSHLERIERIEKGRLDRTKMRDLRKKK